MWKDLYFTLPFQILQLNLWFLVWPYVQVALYYSCEELMRNIDRLPTNYPNLIGFVSLNLKSTLLG